MLIKRRRRHLPLQCEQVLPLSISPVWGSVNILKVRRSLGMYVNRCVDNTRRSWYFRVENYLQSWIWSVSPKSWWGKPPGSQVSPISQCLWLVYCVQQQFLGCVINALGINKCVCGVFNWWKATKYSSRLLSI